MSCSSTNEMPRGPDIVCLTVTNTMTPVDPVLGSTDLISEVRRIVSPTRSGSPSKAKRLPAHMRRGSGTGGRKSPRSAWPSGADLGLPARHRGNRASARAAAADRRMRGSGSCSSKVAISARTGKGRRRSSTVWVWPTQSRSFSSDILVSSVGAGLCHRQHGVERPRHARYIPARHSPIRSGQS